MPAIGKIKGVTEYEFQQSKFYPECPRVPMRTCLVSGSGGGKTTTILAMCLQIYGFDVFQRIIVVSPSIGIDDAWNPLFAEMRKRGIDPKEFTLDQDLLLHSGGSQFLTSFIASMTIFGISAFLCSMV